MFKNKVIRYSTIAMIIAILGYFVIENLSDNSTSSAEEELVIANPEQYKTKLLEERAAKDEQFKTTKDSPIKDKENFHGLHYFEPDLSFRVKANISPYMKDDKEVVVKYTDGTSEKYEKYGYANFTIGGQTQKLLLLKNEAILSVLFKDATSGKQTYGGGRYLDYPLTAVKNNVIMLDFNKAYNPYCVYQETYACPVPPAENTLTVPINAGEVTEGFVHE
ncbi:DUF1684 domain-containing protein [Dyadobacter luticola]|uniref:DUF1684 domain-containing protein n=1 Tax=Dyadobacter luticola TaxID=1979387 RepID=A0A5R9L1Y6_9BACT|nr:DUF1684 domain-containing protein [Dyadobacter luticola]TLV02345.1 DUF1684 domain-containing protein [Dyadobacter luticola]